MTGQEEDTMLKQGVLTLTICAFALQSITEPAHAQISEFKITASDGVDGDQFGSDTSMVTIMPLEDYPSGFTLTFPLGDTLNTLLPIFTWNPSVDPDMGDLIEYQLMISESESMESPVYTEVLTDTSHTVTVPLTDDFKYYWTVSARDTIIEAKIDYATQIEPIFTNNCTSVSCHVPGNTGGGLNLQVGASFDEITGSATTFHAPLVIADNPDISPLIWKLEGVDNNGNPVFGFQMPLNRPPLAQSTIDLIRDWISEGANRTVDDSSGQFSYSDTSSFLLDKQESPLAFSLISPEDESSLDSLRPLFSWDQSIDPDPRDEVKYTLIIRKPTGPDSVVYKVEGIGDTMHQITEDIEIGSYQWLVIAEDADDNNLDTESSEIFSLNVVVGINDEIAGIPEEYDLNQNYPNPFNPTTTIEYSLPQSGDVSLIVYNLLGQEVAKLVNGKLDAGYHEVTWDASNMASGVYIYRLEDAGRRSASPTYIRTKKMVLLK